MLIGVLEKILHPTLGFQLSSSRIVRLEVDVLVQPRTDTREAIELARTSGSERVRGPGDEVSRTRKTDTTVAQDYAIVTRYHLVL
jgi:hypothetical protein